MANKKPPQQQKLKPNERLVCIDLPGEEHEIPCTSFAKVTDVYVLLRKWRDVVFDLNTGSGATYTVESPEDWIYDIEAKKRVRKVTFKDGKRLHIWVGRFFKGNLLLKSKGKLIGTYQISVMDPYSYTAKGDDKPAPIIIALGKGSDASKGASAPTARVGKENNGLGTGLSALNEPSPHVSDFNASLQKRMAQGIQDQSMHIVEIKDTTSSNVPTAIADFFKKGGEETAIDTNDIMTRNWLWQQITGTVAYVNDNRGWIRDLWNGRFRLQRVNHRIGPRWYVVFSGVPQLGQEIQAWRYGTGHRTVLSITAGVGSAGSVSRAAWEAAKGSMKNAGLLSLIFTCTLDAAEWLNDYEQLDPKTGKRKKDVFDLIYKIGINIAKAGLSGAIASGMLAVGLFAATVFFGVTTLPISALVIGTIALSVWVGYRIDALDKATGATDKLNKMIRENANYLYKTSPNDYNGYDKSLEQALAFGMGA